MMASQKNIHFYTNTNTKNVVRDGAATAVVLSTAVDTDVFFSSLSPFDVEYLVSRVTRCPLSPIGGPFQPSDIQGVTCLGRCKGEQECATRCFAQYGSGKLDSWLTCTLEVRSGDDVYIVCVYVYAACRELMSTSFFHTKNAFRGGDGARPSGPPSYTRNLHNTGGCCIKRRKKALVFTPSCVTPVDSKGKKNTLQSVAVPSPRNTLQSEVHISPCSEGLPRDCRHFIGSSPHTQCRRARKTREHHCSAVASQPSTARNALTCFMASQLRLYSRSKLTFSTHPAVVLLLLLNAKSG